MKKTIRNLREVDRVISHPSVFFTIKDDYKDSPSGLARELLGRVDVLVLMPNQDTVVIFKMMNMSMVEIHLACIEGESRKRIAREVLKAIDFMFSMAPSIHKFIAMIPEDNKLPCRLAGTMGMEREGRVKEGILKSGEYKDLIVYGATKDMFYNKFRGEILCHQQ